MKPKVAVFDFTCCEGCELQILNCEEELADLLSALDFVEFREAMTEKADYYDIAFIDGACSRKSEMARLKDIRKRARMVIPIGACACMGGVNCLKNYYPMDEVLRSEYGEKAEYYETIPARHVSAVIPVDFFIPGCPIVKKDFIRVVQEILAGRIPYQYNDPVCAECKVAGNVCVFEKGMTCLGPITRGGCEATCITGGAVCWGCRGFIDKPNIIAEKLILEQAGLSVEEISKRFNLFNACKDRI
ncbi:MAG: NADH:ubiquinone oxidoreductase [Deltaproteobacteria bacterium]|nr:NADH:ubiquinone oxidoreductase [Deltaproteobacteria bacterium]